MRFHGGLSAAESCASPWTTPGELWASRTQWGSRLPGEGPYIRGREEMPAPVLMPSYAPYFTVLRDVLALVGAAA
jgi:hypothetical protein